MGNTNNNKGGDKNFIGRFIVLFQSSNKKTEFTESQIEALNTEIKSDLFNSKAYNPDILYDEFLAKLEKRKKHQRQLIFVTTCILILTLSFAVVAKRTGFFINLSGSNEINFTSVETVPKVKSDFKNYSDLLSVEAEYNIKIPLFTEFPEEMKIINILAEKLNNVISINIIYENLDGSQYLKVLYKYYEKPDISSTKTDSNSTYDYLGESNSYDNAPYISSDMERQLAVLNYGDYVINVETKYKEAQLADILNSLKMKE